MFLTPWASSYLLPYESNGLIWRSPTDFIVVLTPSGPLILRSAGAYHRSTKLDRRFAMNSGGYHQPLKNQPTKKKKLDLITTKRYDSFLRAVPKTQLVMMAVLDDGNQTSRQVDLMLQDKWGEVCAGEKEIGGSGGSLEPPGPLFTHLHTVYMGCSERLPTRLNPLAERACFSQVAGQPPGNRGRARADAAARQADDLVARPRGTVRPTAIDRVAPPRDLMEATILFTISEPDCKPGPHMVGMVNSMATAHSNSLMEVLSDFTVSVVHREV